MSTAPEDLPDLGMPLAEYRLGALSSVLMLAGGLGALAASLAVMGALYAVLVLKPAARAAAGGAVLLKLGMVGLFLFGTGLSVLRRMARSRGLRVALFEGGLVRQQGDTVEALRWADVDAVRFPAEEGEEAGPVRFTLLGRGGRRLEFPPHLPGADELLAAVERHTLPHMAPPAREALEAGAVIRFGALCVDRQGLYHGQDGLAWERLVSVERGAHSLTVWREGRHRVFCRVPLGEVPSADVLAALAEGLRHVPE